MQEERNELKMGLLSKKKKKKQNINSWKKISALHNAKDEKVHLEGSTLGMTQETFDKVVCVCVCVCVCV